MKVLLNYTYFPSILHFVLLLRSEKVWFETFDNYEKQTYRNRAYIYGANGIQTLSIPVHYTQKNRQSYKDVLISHATPWQSIHRKSMESAYRSSPYYEFYEDDLAPLFLDKPKFLLDFNIRCFEAVCNCLSLTFNSATTTRFEKKMERVEDYRFLVNTNAPIPSLEPYIQVFSEKHGFIQNLSILDLLFNEGPNALSYLERQTIPFLP